VPQVRMAATARPNGTHFLLTEGFGSAIMGWPYAGRAPEHHLFLTRLALHLGAGLLRTQTPEWLQELDDLSPGDYDQLTVTVLLPA
jgi:hypothetical protein